MPSNAASIILFLEVKNLLLFPVLFVKNLRLLMKYTLFLGLDIDNWDVHTWMLFLCYCLMENLVLLLGVVSLLTLNTSSLLNFSVLFWVLQYSYYRQVSQIWFIEQPLIFSEVWKYVTFETVYLCQPIHYIIVRKEQYWASEPLFFLIAEPDLYFLLLEAQLQSYPFLFYGCSQYFYCIFSYLKLNLSWDSKNLTPFLVAQCFFPVIKQVVKIKMKWRDFEIQGV